MVLLRALNYDFVRHEHTILTHAVGKGETTLNVENSTGFTDDDYILLGPYTEKSEIVRVDAVVASNKALTITAPNFNHPAKKKIYRLPYDKVRFYSATTATGTYTLIDTVDLNFSDVYTNYNYPTGTSALYYKRTFYNTVLAAESDIELADYWQTSDEELNITPQFLRSFMQLGPNDYPSDQDLWNYIRISQDKFGLDLATSVQAVKRLGTLFLAKSFVLRGLATKSVAKGYVTVNAEGRQITKSFQELVLEAENTEEEYKSFLINNGRTEVSKTDFFDDTTVIDNDTRQETIDLMTGTQNIMDHDASKRTFGRRKRY